jgi:hypothetical protein
MRHLPAAQGERDANHAEIVAAYEQMHCSVLDLSSLGFGCPDILVGAAGGALELVEIKTAHGRLSKSQNRFIRDWRGPKPKVVRSIGEAIDHASALRRRGLNAWAERLA